MRNSKNICQYCTSFRGASRTTATSKMERFVIIVNGIQPLTIITKRSILDVAAVLDPPLSLSLALIPYSTVLRRKLSIKNVSRFKVLKISKFQTTLRVDNKMYFKIQ